MPYCGAEFEIMLIYKGYIYSPTINTQRLTLSPFDDTPVISYSDHQTAGLYQGSADCYERYCKSNIICRLQQSQTIHYCNQSVLAVVLDLNIFVFGITIFDIISRIALVRFSLLCPSCLYKFTGIGFYIFCL